MKKKTFLPKLLTICVVLIIALLIIKADVISSRDQSASVLGGVTSKSSVISAKDSKNRESQNLFNQVMRFESELSKANLLYNNAKSDTAGKISANKIDESLIVLSAKRKVVVKKLMEGNPTLFIASAMKPGIKKLLPIKAQNNVEVKKSIKGNVDVIQIDDFNNPENSFLKYSLSMDGKRYNLYVTSDLNIQSSTEIQAEGYVLDDNIVIDTNSKDIKITNEKLRQPKDGGTPDSVGNQRTLVLLLKAGEADYEPFTTAQAQDLVFNGQFQNFMSEQSYNKVSFSGDVYGWYTLGHALSCYGFAGNYGPFPTSVELNQIVTTYNINLDSYDRIVYMSAGPTTGGCSYVGKGVMLVNGTEYNLSQLILEGVDSYSSPSFWGAHPFTWTNLDLVLSHEMGHSLGVVHANSWTCEDDQILYGENCSHMEYGNNYDTMATGNFSLHFNPYFKEALGWIAPSEIININSSGQYALNPLELSGGMKLAKVAIKNTALTPYAIEFRKPSGFDSNLKNLEFISNTKGLLINRIQNFNRANFLPETELLDMSPSGDWDSLRKASLNLPNASSSVYSFIDEGKAITIGPVLDVSSTSISFNVEVEEPICQRRAPNSIGYSYSDVITPGTTGYVYIPIQNNDYYGCSPADFNVTISLPETWDYSLDPVEDIKIEPGNIGPKYLQFNVPESTPKGIYNVGINLINKTSGQNKIINLQVRVLDPHVITGIEPSYGPAGTEVVISGTGFSDSNNWVHIQSKGTGNFWTDSSRIGSEENKIYYMIPSIVYSCDINLGCKSIIESPIPVGLYSIFTQVNGSLRSIDFYVGETTFVLPSVNTIGTSTLTMKYATSTDGQFENIMEADYRVVINAGTESQKLVKNGAFNTSAIDSTGSNISNGTRTTYSRLSTSSNDTDEYFEIPANSSSTFSVKTYFDPKTMFAGTYHGVLHRVNLGEMNNQNSLTIPAPNTTNPLTIIGERSPYIISLSTSSIPANQAVLINGVRFATSTNTVTLTNKVGQVFTRVLPSTNNNQTITLIPNVPVGFYSLEITHPKTGKSNIVGLEITAPISQAVNISLWNGPATSTASTTFSYNLNWEGGPTLENQRIFVHFVDASGNTRFLNSVVPPIATTLWNGLISTPITVKIPAGTPTGTYRVKAGLYNVSTGARLPLTPGLGVTVDNQLRYHVGNLYVSPDQTLRLSSCNPSPATTTVGARVTWNASAMGGVGPYSYYWSDVANVIDPNHNSSTTRVYNTSGRKYMSIAVIDSVNNRTAWEFCPGTVNVLSTTTTLSILPWLGATSTIASSSMAYALNWNGGPTLENQNIFVHFVDASGNTRFLNSVNPTPATTLWSGTRATTISVNIPPATPIGTYKVMAGLYNTSTGARLPLIPASGVTVDNQLRYHVGTLNIRASSQSNSPNINTGGGGGGRIRTLPFDEETVSPEVEAESIQEQKMIPIKESIPEEILRSNMTNSYSSNVFEAIFRALGF